jgi:HTH-type transcriptional regulator / antitoxin HigA
MKTIKRSRDRVVRVHDTYMQMIRKFPLRPIRSDTECDLATAILDKYIARKDMDKGTEDYIIVLVGLVEEYEEKHHPVDTSHITPLQSLKYLMGENNMTTADLGRLLGNSGLASMILHGNRAISKANAKILGKRFGLNPGAFI